MTAKEQSHLDIIFAYQRLQDAIEWHNREWEALMEMQGAK